VFDPGHEWFLGEVNAAAMLLDWISKRHNKDIRAGFGIGGGCEHAGCMMLVTP